MILRRIAKEISTCRRNSAENFTSSQSNLRDSIKRFHSSFFDQESTIYALSSGFGKCGVAVIRVSGENTSDMILKMTSRKQLPKPRQASLTSLFDCKTGEHLDKALLLWFPKPHSFTGEDVCELHVHGGTAVIAAVFQSLSCIPGLVPAEPGDYTRRAFLNGKLDLTEVEGLGDLIHAETEEQRKQALKQMEGRLSCVVQTWSKELLRCLAHLEAFIDFGEDQHIDDTVTVEVAETLENLRIEINNHLNDKRRGERLRSGVKLAIIGEPNVGKSSLLNLISAKPAAIVSPIAGTTRDIVETTLDIDGFPVILSDTAGLRNTSDLIEIEGVRRAKATAKDADLILFVVAADKLCNNLSNTHQELTDLISKTVNDGEQDSNIILVINKCDLPNEEQIASLNNSLRNISHQYTTISCQTQHGFDNFIKTLAKNVRALCSGDSSSIYSPTLTQERHRVHVNKCLDNVDKSLNIIQTDVVIATEYLRIAMNQLGKLTGKVDAEKILDVIFKDFCIGK